MCPKTLTFQTEFECLANPDRLHITDKIVRISIAGDDVRQSFSEDEKHLGFVIGMRIGRAYFNPLATPWFVELGDIMDTIVRAMYPRMVYHPSVVTVQKTMNRDSRCTGGTVTVHTRSRYARIPNLTTLL